MLRDNEDEDLYQLRQSVYLLLGDQDRLDLLKFNEPRYEFTVSPN
jgi:hypothetical protein